MEDLNDDDDALVASWMGPDTYTPYSTCTQKQCCGGTVEALPWFFSFSFPYPPLLFFLMCCLLTQPRSDFLFLLLSLSPSPRFPKKGHQNKTHPPPLFFSSSLSLSPPERPFVKKKKKKGGMGERGGGVVEEPPSFFLSSFLSLSLSFCFLTFIYFWGGAVGGKVFRV